jgi:DNA-binding IscR family transcriptional regulator
MQKVLQISRAASIGLHGTVLIYKSPVRLNVVRIAKQLQASDHHVAKVLQKLAKKNVLQSYKGPSGDLALTNLLVNYAFLKFMRP